ncbi:MAG: ABC transporter ATP-binding protein [Actinomycetota bacterium]
MTVDARIRLQRGATAVDATLRAPSAGTLALVGPNGAGKSTIIAALAGLLPIQDGQVSVDGTTWVDTDRGVHLAPQSRSVGVMFQALRLFPWLNARDNVAYPLRRQGMDKGAARRQASELLDSLGLSDHLTQKPIELSGGEAQRVALARAIVVKPALLLLDEPLSDLDVTTRGEVRHLLREHLSSFEGSTILVTHDHLEAGALADSVVVLENGRITQSGTFEDLAARPRSKYVANLRGTNLYEGTGSEGAVELAHTTLVVAQDPPREALVAIDPRAVALHLDEPKGSPRNAWLLTIKSLEPADRTVRVSLTGDLDLVAEVTPGSVSELDLAAGRRVWATVKATEISVYEA